MTNTPTIKARIDYGLSPENFHELCKAYRHISDIYMSCGVELRAEYKAELKRLGDLIQANAMPYVYAQPDGPEDCT